MNEKIFTIVDVETSGSSANYDRIIEIGILRIENGKIVKTFKSLINPEQSLSPYITNITGIRTEDLLNAPTFEDIKDEVFELFEGAIFVAHNARFDYGFIRNEFKRAGMNFNKKCLCSVRLSRKLFGRYKRHDLSSIIDRFDFVCENRHRAFDDAKVIWDFMEMVRAKGRGEEMEMVIDQLLKKPTLPQSLDEKTLKNLPYGPGVYIFYGPEDEVLYVGKSKSLRNRVLSHFSNDHTSTKEMNLCQQTKRIETRETAGELGALLLESQLVKDLSPLYNRQLRKATLLVVARKIEIGGYNSVVLERTDEISLSDYRNVMGVFRSIAQGKEFISTICDELGLCPKILGIQKGNGACFSHQLRKCKGACVGKDAPEDFNKRFNKAFARRRIKSWTYDTPISIEEKGDEGSQTFILDNWCLVAEHKTEDGENHPVAHTPVFDYDRYKIFVKYIFDKQNRNNIKVLHQRSLEELYLPESEYVLSVD